MERNQGVKATVPAGSVVLRVDDGKVFSTNRYFNDILGHDVSVILCASWTDLFADAETMLSRIIEGRWLGAKAVIGLFAANTVDGDDIALYGDDGRTDTLATPHFLRQPLRTSPGRPTFCLASTVSPAASSLPAT